MERESPFAKWGQDLKMYSFTLVSVPGNVQFLVYMYITVGEGVRERSVVSDILEDTWEKLLAIATAREDLQQFR